jgi:aspartate racemase
MKSIGLIGGLSWESTSTYYTLINQQTKHRLGGLHSAKIIMNSVDFAEIEDLQRQGGWQQTAILLGNAAQSLESAGADFFLICANTMHIVAEEVEAMASIPVLHIAEATAGELVNDGRKKVGLLGTRYTMEKDFYKQRLKDKFDIEVVVPDEAQREILHNIVYEELCLGIIADESRNKVLAMIDSLHQQGAECIILGCTEIPLLVTQQDTDIPLYDTTAIHARCAVELALAHKH